MLRKDYTIRREPTEHWLAEKFFQQDFFEDQPRDGCVHPAWLGSTIQTSPNLTILYAG